MWQYFSICDVNSLSVKDFFFYRVTPDDLSTHYNQCFYLFPRKPKLGMNTI